MYLAAAESAPTQVAVGNRDPWGTVKFAVPCYGSGIILGASVGYILGGKNGALLGAIIGAPLCPLVLRAVFSSGSFTYQL